MAPTSLSLLAFGFGNLAMLGWLAVAAVPVLIHLWNRRKHRELQWAAVEFLLAAVRKSSRRMRLQELLLLLVRMAIVLLVVLATAEPYWQQSPLRAARTARIHRVLVFDVSYSMGHRQGGESRLDRSKSFARQLVQECERGDAFTLVALAQPSRVIVNRPATLRNELLEEIDNVALSHSGADLPHSLQLLQQLVQRVQRDNPRFEQHEVVIFSDMCRTTWRAREDAGAAADIAGKIADLAGRATVRVIDVGSEDTGNLAVTRLRTTDPWVVVGEDVTFEATVHNFGSSPETGCRMELVIGDTAVADRTFEVPARGDATVSLRHRFAYAGVQSIAARMRTDALAIDDVRWVAVPVKDAVSVLCVEGRRGAADYVAHALDPEASTQSLIQPQIMPESALLDVNLEEFDCLFLCNLSQFTNGEARVLSRYLARGGGLVVFLGDRVEPEVYNRVLAKSASTTDAEGWLPARILPAKIGELVSWGEYPFDALDYRHPIVDPFRGRVNAGLLTTPVYRYFRLAPFTTDPPAVSALAFAGGDPAIVTSPVGEGRVVLFATAGSLLSVDQSEGTPWTTWPVWPSFLPIVRQSLAYAVGNQYRRYNFLVGESLGLSAPEMARGDIRVTRPDHGQERVQSLQTTQSAMPWRYERTDISGVYVAENNAADAPAIPLAVNLDSVESDLARVGQEEVPRAFRVSTTWQDAEGSGQSSTASDAAHRLFLQCAFLLMVVELALAWWFGRETR